MNTQAVVNNPLKAWLSEFLLIRGCFKGPTGKTIYSYQVTEQEYRTLHKLLKANIRLVDKPLYINFWSACFCLFVSEWYRRDYNGIWSWAGPETELGINLNSAQHARLAEKGLEYWKRPIRYRENGRDWLGSLFSEGGLPWPLVQSDTHCFGRAVKRGIKQYYRTEGNRRTTADLMAEYESDLPLIFQNLETRQRLAGIVDQLMYLVENYHLSDHDDPATYLDSKLPGWTTAFPIPLDTSNARGLINDWLRDAGQRRQERKDALALDRELSCDHYLYGDLHNWDIITELVIPSAVTIDKDISQVSSTRFELAYYEGERMLARGPAVYGHVENERLYVNFRTHQVQLQRHLLCEPVSIRLLDNGCIIHCIDFNDSAIDYVESPLVFEKYSERWKLVGQESCSLSGELVRIRLPDNFTIETYGSEEAPTVLAVEGDGAQWFESSSSVSLRGNNEHYVVELNQSCSDKSKPTLVGEIASYESQPPLIFMGWPAPKYLDSSCFNTEELLEFCNGNLLGSSHCPDTAGSVRYSLRTMSGKTILQRRFAILPKEFKLSYLPATKDKPSKLQIDGAFQLSLNIVSNALISRKVIEGQAVVFYLQHSGETPPSDFILEVKSQNVRHPVQLRLGYPYQGAHLISPNDQLSNIDNLTLDNLVGYRIALTSGLSQGQIYNIQLELICTARPHPRRNFDIKVGFDTVYLNLFSYQTDLSQMLGAVDEQDAYVKLTVESGHRLINLNIRRYNGRLLFEGDSSFCIGDLSTHETLDVTEVEAMLLSDPKREPLRLNERTTQGVGVGIFEIPHTMLLRGPWIIYPIKDGGVNFRPALFPTSGAPDSGGDVFSLHHATEVFHPKLNPNVINDQITAMAENFSHSGWQYLADIKQHYSHLSLSSFESWRALSHNPLALAFSVFRLELDEEFCARIRDELAVIWEAVPLKMWCMAYQNLTQGLQITGCTDATIEKLLKNRSSVLRFVVSGFDYLGNYLQTEGKSELTKIPPEAVLPGWYMSLRQLHDSNNHWPTEINSELVAWINKQPLSPQIKRLSQIGFHNSVVYLPIFIAFVTAGREHLSDLHVHPAYLKFAIRRISDFDRQGWFAPIHALMVSYLLASENEV